MELSNVDTFGTKESVVLVIHVHVHVYSDFRDCLSSFQGVLIKGLYQWRSEQYMLGGFYSVRTAKVHSHSVDPRKLRMGV